MIVGTAIIPSAPLLVPGVSRTLPDGVGRVCDATDAALERLPACDVAVLLAAEDRDTSVRQSRQGLYDATSASLAGIGRPDITAPVRSHADGMRRISRVVQYPLYRAETLPLGLAVLALLVGVGPALVPIAVPRGAAFDTLTALGAGVVEALAGPEVRAVVVAAGDLSAGLDERSPMYLIEGAKDWDAAVVAVVDSGRLDGLARLGPGEAGRVGALGWAPLAVLHGVTARAKLGVVRQHYSAPRGVGYLVAHGA